MRRIEIKAAKVTADPREEERAARERQRQLDRLHRGASRAREREERSKLRRLILEELATARGKRCGCGLRQVRTMAELMALGEGCTRGYGHVAGCVCPSLDAVRRRMGR